MYQFSRQIYRDLAHQVLPYRGEDIAITRQRFLRACELSMERLAADRHYFAKPVRTLFVDVRHFFAMSDQMRVFGVIEHHVTSAVACHASTRKGTACQRVPLPGGKYCPSHKHLEEELEVSVAA
jgi:hypothetical protein